MNYRWNILDIYTDAENCVTQVRYLLTLTDNGDVVQTEGYYNFSNQIKIFPELTETQVVSWIENDPSQDVVVAIKSRLEEQMANVKANNGPIRAPWLGPETFTVSL